MTPKQRERIKQAALDLSRELSEAGGDFEVYLHKLEVTGIQHTDRKYNYAVEVTCTIKDQITRG